MLRFYRLQQLILAFGDLALIVLATQLAPFIRLGHMLDVFRVHTGATTPQTDLPISGQTTFGPQITQITQNERPENLPISGQTTFG
ncbi:MAG: hypothetical protein KAV83_12035 [Desulfobacterales bacterium]|nr:hypothetical protein [Desulfobacterales bacterium]